MSQIRIAVIGADHLDPDHHIALNTLSESGQVAAFALDAEPTEAGFDTLKSAMQTDALDAVIMSGPRGHLADWLKFSVEQGWPVYSTLPVPNGIEEMVEIRRAEQIARGSHLQFGFTARHHQSVSTALGKAESGEYGQLVTMRAVCGVAETAPDRPIMFEYGAQILDVMQAFAGPFQDITGFADLDRSDVSGSETNILATLRTHAGILASLHVSATQWRPTFRVELGFERGYLWLEGLNADLDYFGQEALIYARTDGTGAQHETVDRFEHSNGALVSLTAFLERLNDPSRPKLGTSQQAFDTLNTIQRILAADPIYAPIQERQVS
ncbi:MAG: hypothetical protein ABJH52_05080 [Henriciella sp.]